MALDPRISLQAQTVDLGGVGDRVLQGLALRQANLDSQQRRKLVDLQTKKAETELSEFERNASTREAESFTERELAAAKSLSVAATRVKPLLDAGDVEGAKSLLLNRKTRLDEEGIDSSDTQELLGMLDQDPKSALNTVDKTIEFGTRLGFLKAPAKAEGFTLSQGQQRFDAQGNPIASVEPASKLLSPQELSQRKEIAAAGKTDINLTPGQRAVDQSFGKEYAEFVAGGGFADVKKNIGQLKAVREDLKNQNLTGPFTGSTPDFIRKFTNAKSLAARDAVEEVVQRNLRLVLGAQFTEKEGERLIKRSFNETLSEEENEKRLNRLIGQIETAAQAKQEAADYFEKNGTLTGFRGKVYSAADFANDAVPTNESNDQIEELLKKYAPSR